MSYTTPDDVRKLLNLQYTDVFIMIDGGTQDHAIKTLSRWCSNSTLSEVKYIKALDGSSEILSVGVDYIFIYPNSIQLAEPFVTNPNDKLIVTYATDVTDTLIQNNIDLAEGKVNTYLYPYYDTPFKADIPMIKTITTFIASFYLGIKLYTQENPSVMESLKLMYNDAKEMLQALADGRYTLTDTNGNVISRKVPVITNTINEEHYIPEVGIDSDSKIGKLFRNDETW